VLPVPEFTCAQEKVAAKRPNPIAAFPITNNFGVTIDKKNRSLLDGVTILRLGAAGFSTDTPEPVTHRSAHPVPENLRSDGGSTGSPGKEFTLLAIQRHGG
jgi:hypothetical protein